MHTPLIYTQCWVLCDLIVFYTVGTLNRMLYDQSLNQIVSISIYTLYSLSLRIALVIKCYKISSCIEVQREDHNVLQFHFGIFYQQLIEIKIVFDPDMLYTVC